MVSGLRCSDFCGFVISINVILVITPLFYLRCLISNSCSVVVARRRTGGLSRVSSSFLDVGVRCIRGVFGCLPVVYVIFVVINMVFAF